MTTNQPTATNTTMLPTRFIINVRQMVRELDPDDARIAGAYLILLDAEKVADFTAEKRASIANDIFHAKIGIAEADDFEITILDANSFIPVDTDADHEDGEGEGYGDIECISDFPIPYSMPKVRALLRTICCTKSVEFDASHWLATAAPADICALMNETERTGPVIFGESYGGCIGISDSIALESAETNADLKAVYSYMEACVRVGKEPSGSDCFVHAGDLKAWICARNRQLYSGAGPEVGYVSQRIVFDSELSEPYVGAVLTRICKSTWEIAATRWKLHGGPLPCEYIIESSDIFGAMSNNFIIATGEEGYSDEGEQAVEEALTELNCYLQARLLYEGKADINAAFLSWEHEPL